MAKVGKIVGIYCLGNWGVRMSGGEGMNEVILPLVRMAPLLYFNGIFVWFRADPILYDGGTHKVQR
jgi:hypothetical protein